MPAFKDVVASVKQLGSKVVGRADNLSIRTKLFVYAAVLITLLLLLAGFVLFQIHQIQNRHIPARGAAREMEASLLNMRVHELNFINETDSLNAEFYLKQKSASVDAWQESYRQFEANHATLTKSLASAETKRELETIQPLVTKYRDTFLLLTGTYRERGFQSFGREGALMQRADALQASLRDTPALVTFLKLKEAQDRFFLYHEASSIGGFNEQAAQLRLQLKKPNDRVLFDEYVRMFEEVKTIHQKIGLTNSDGLRGQLTQLTSEISPHIQSVEAAVLRLTSSGISSISQSIYVVTIALAVVAVLMAFMLGRLITRKVTLLSIASKRIAAGDFRYHLPTQTRDELGQLSKSFNAMAEQLRKGQEKLHERALALTQSVKRFELVSRAVNEAIYEWDVKTGTLTWGQGIVSVLGISQAIK